MARTNHSKRMQKSVVAEFRFRDVPKDLTLPPEERWDEENLKREVGAIAFYATQKRWRKTIQEHKSGLYRDVSMTCVISSCSLRLNDEEEGCGELVNVRTYDDFQGKGYASIMMEVMIEMAMAFGLKKIILGVQRGKENIPAVKLYERVGFLFDSGSDYRMTWINPLYRSESNEE